tara:strand:- start:408 stop:1376 length:969 start_codon:yes stop_codon:yes gene_type:complete
MKKINIIYLFAFILSCEQNEIPIIPHAAGNIITKQINMGSSYDKQIFYSLNDNLEVTENIKTDWDLGFESSTNGWNIIINSSTFSQLAELIDINFNDIISINNLNWNWDNPAGIHYNSAFGDYRNKHSVYILDRGYKLSGSSRGYKKIMIDSITNSAYYIKYANLDNTDIRHLEVKKDNSYNFQYIELDNGDIINIEPKKEYWDLLFTQYTHLFIDNEQNPAYLVTGVLTNYLNNIMVATDTINKFTDIELNMIEQYNFTNMQNKIGYDWKSYNFTSQSYTINSEITYIISDVDDRYFKLHFIDFYDDNGEKGNPKFEMQKL